MRTFNRWTKTLLASVAALTFSIPAVAYEVNVLDGPGAQSKAMNNGNYALAIERLEIRLQHETSSSDVQLTNLCTAYVVTRQFDKAIDACDRAVAADGEFVGTAFNSRGVLNTMQGDFISALADFEKAGRKSNYPSPRYNHGDRTASMYQLNSRDRDTDDALQIAARNHVAADRQWAALKKETETLAADAK